VAKTTYRAVALVGLVAVGVAGSEPAALGAFAHDAKVTLMVLIDNDPGVPANILGPAREVVGRVFQHIDVEILWIERGDARLENLAFLSSVMIVHLLTREMADRMNAPDDLLGVAIPGTGHATLFYNRIERLSSTRGDQDIAGILGHAVAHEMGHLLLPPPAHSASGIMRAGLDTQLATQGRLFFTADQARLIRTRLGGS
jgi:hypothetical protein